MEKDLSSATATGQMDIIRPQIEKLDVHPGDVIVIRSSDGLRVSLREAERVRNMVLEAFRDAGWKPAILFVDGYELAVIRPKNDGGSHES